MEYKVSKKGKVGCSDPQPPNLGGLMLKLGQYNTLTVTKEVDFGLYLDGGNEGDILLPKKYVPAGTKVGDQLRVFIYLDQEERTIATTETPFAQVGEFAYLECTWVNKYGAFLNWGLTKDLFCPFREQKKRMEVGNNYIVHIHIDRETYRIVASAKVEHFLHPIASIAPIAPIDLLVWQKTDLGFKVIVDNQYAGLIYENEIFQPIHIGDRLNGYIKTIRPDGKLDITLQPTGRKLTKDFAQTLLEWLQQHDGHCPLGDKSDADDIKEMFHVSKKSFKRAVGDLYKRHLVIPGDDSLTLVQ